MANVKITALPAAADVVDADLVPVVDDPGGTPVTKKSTFSQVWTWITGKCAAAVVNFLGVSTGAAPASAGAIRLSNNEIVRWRNAAGSADIVGPYVNGANDLVFGDAANSGNTYILSGTAGFIVGQANTHEIRNLAGTTTWAKIGAAATDYISLGVTPAGAGFIRVPYSTSNTIIGAKNSVGADSAVIAQNGVDTYRFGPNGGVSVLNGAYAELHNDGSTRLQLRTAAGDFLSLGASPASSGNLRVEGGFLMHSNVGGTNRKVLAATTGAEVVLGGTGVSECSAVILRTSISGTTPSIYWQPNGSNVLVGCANGIQIGSSTVSLGSGVGVVGVTNAGTNPSANPTGGGILYADAGAGKWRGSGGTVTTFGPAEPHCSTCGRDFALEHRNDTMDEHLAICLPCMVDTLTASGVNVSAFAMVNKRTKTKQDWTNHMVAVAERERLAKEAKADEKPVTEPVAEL